MRKSLLTSSVLLLAMTTFSQLTARPDGGNQKAWVGEQIGITDITIQYDRPAVKKTRRRGLG